MAMIVDDPRMSMVRMLGVFAQYVREHNVKSPDLMVSESFVIGCPVEGWRLEEKSGNIFIGRSGSIYLLLDNPPVYSTSGVKLYAYDIALVVYGGGDPFAICHSSLAVDGMRRLSNSVLDLLAALQRTGA